MSRRLRGRAPLRGLTLAAVVAGAGAVVLIASGAGGEALIPPGAIRLSVTSKPTTQPLPQGFVGFSFEFGAIEGYAGKDPRSVNPVLEQLMREVSPQGSPVLRIGGDSTDWTWWPVRGMSRPPGIRYTLTRRWLRVVRALAWETGARLILGINLEADDVRIAAAEVRAFENGIGQTRIEALELGNEPELWGTFGWYRARNGREVTGRPATYGLAAFTRDFSRFARALPGLPLAGPTTGAPRWRRNLGRFIKGAHPLALVTMHRYPLANCFTPKSSPKYPTIAHLLAPAASRDLAASIAPDVALAHAHHLRLRLDELNSVACGGKLGVSDTFASALWVIDALFNLASVGVDGVNVHTFPIANYGMFTFKHTGHRWRGFVRAPYRGLLMFARAAPAGSRQLRTSWRTNGAIHAWATRAPDNAIRVVLINDSPSRARLVAVRIPGAHPPATLVRLTAAGLRATHGVALQTQGTQLQAVDDAYLIRLPGPSAAMLTIP